MTTQIRTATRGARPLRTLALDDTQGGGLAWELAQSRHACRILSKALENTWPLRLTLSDVRVSLSQVVILTKTSSLRSRLNQLLPRLEEALRKAGFNQSLNVRIRNESTRPTPRLLASGVPRHGNPRAARDMQREAESIEDDKLRNALIELAKSLNQ